MECHFFCKWRKSLTFNLPRSVPKTHIHTVVRGGVQHDLLSVEKNPRLTSTAPTRNSNVCKSSVLNGLSKTKYYPYKIHLVQEFSDDDFDGRVDFCEHILENCHSNPEGGKFVGQMRLHFV